MSADPTKISLQTNVKAERDPTLVRMQGITAHGHVPFDVPFITQIAPNLWQGGCQNGLELPHFIKNIVSLYPWERYKIKHEMESEMYVRMYDSLDQSTEEIETIAKWVHQARWRGPVLVHCQAGLNRSSLVVARVLMLDGYSPEQVIDMLRKKRSPACLCNPAFEQYIRDKDPRPYCDVVQAITAARKFWSDIDPENAKNATLEETQRKEGLWFITLAFSNRGLLFDDERQYRLFIIDAATCKVSSMHAGTIDEYEGKQNVEAD